MMATTVTHLSLVNLSLWLLLSLPSFVWNIRSLLPLCVQTAAVAIIATIAAAAAAATSDAVVIDFAAMATCSCAANRQTKHVPASVFS